MNLGQRGSTRFGASIGSRIPDSCEEISENPAGSSDRAKWMRDWFVIENWLPRVDSNHEHPG